MDRREAADTLRTAGEIGARVRRQTRWYAIYATVYGGAAFALTLALGFLPSQLAVQVTLAIWFVTILVLTFYSIGQRVAPRHFALLHGGAIGGWGVIFGTTVGVGYAVFPGEPAWWVPGAVLCAVPPLCAAGLTLTWSRKVER